MKVNPEILDMYIEVCKKDYPISTEMQPRFWEAVKSLVQNPDEPVSELINEEKTIILSTDYGCKHFKSEYPYLEKVEDIARMIADEIREFENPKKRGFILFKFIKEYRRGPKYKPPQKKR